jgi:hypothetical protein
MKLSLIFEMSQPAAGWSETIYLPGTDVAASIALAESLLALRIAILPFDCECPGYRLYVVGTKRNGVTIYKNPPTAGGWTVDDLSTEPWSAILLACNSNYQLMVNKYIHGIPQSQVVAGQYTPTGPFTTALTAYIAGLKAGAVLYAKNPAAVGPKTEWNITFANPAKLVEHRVGRPFGLLVGRRMVRT